MSKWPISLVEPERALQWRRIPPAKSSDWSTFKRAFLGLTQVCRQIRREFLPNYESKFEAGIELAELHAYLITVVHKQMRRDSYAKIFVIFPPGDFAVPVRDLILLCSILPEHKLCLRCTAFDMDHGRMNPIFFARHNPRWLDCVIRQASRVEARTISSFRGLARLVVYLKPEWVEEWMWRNESTYKEVTDWRWDCGLESFDSLTLPLIDEDLYKRRKKRKREQESSSE
jgi:hypothetical protein